MDGFFTFMMNLFNEIITWIIHDRSITYLAVNASGVPLMYEYLKNNLYLIRPIADGHILLIIKSQTAKDAFSQAATMFKAIESNRAVSNQGGLHGECTLRCMLEDKTEDEAFKLLTIINNYILDVRRKQREIERRLTQGRIAK